MEHKTTDSLWHGHTIGNIDNLTSVATEAKLKGLDLNEQKGCMGSKSPSSLQLDCRVCISLPSPFLERKSLVMLGPNWMATLSYCRERGGGGRGLCTKVTLCFV